MIGGKLQTGDVFVEVEDLKTYNVAPAVYPGVQFIGEMVNAEATVGSNQYFDLIDGGEWVRMGPLWAIYDPDVFGNREYELDNVFISRKVFALHTVSADINGTAGKFYSMSIKIRTHVISMPGHQDAIPSQPDCRINLYATNGNEAEDVLIAQSAPINPSDPANAGWPFHPGYREWTVAVNAVQAMPVGKTYFRLEFEYDSTWTANKSIFLPESYWPSGFPPQLHFFDLYSKSLDLYETTVPEQDWVSTGSSLMYYNWEDQAVAAASGGIKATFDIPTDSLISTYGGRFTFASTYNGSFTVQITGGTTFTSSSLVGDGTIKWFEIDNIPTSAFSAGSITLTVNATSIYFPSLHANINHDDTDGYNYWTYTDLTGHVSRIEVNRYDTEVSTAIITLRESDVDLDTGTAFDMGKRVRIRANTTSDSVGYGWYEEPDKHAGVLFVGEVYNRRATYPRAARPEVKVVVVNKFPVLQEKTSYCLSSLEDYRLMVPYMGIEVATDAVFRAPRSFNPNSSITGFDDFEGRWVLKDLDNGFTVLDAIMVTRDSQFGYVWFDRFGVLNLKSTIPSDAITFTDATPGTGEFSYSKVDLHFDTANVINYLRLDELEWVQTRDENFEFHDDIKKTEMSVFNQGSMNKYRKAEHKMQVFKQTDYTNYETKILDKYATPVVTASTLSFPVRNQSELDMASQLDIYQWINVVYTGKLDSSYRVNSIKHVIVPGEVWKVELGFGVNLDGVLWD